MQEAGDQEMVDQESEQVVAEEDEANGEEVKVDSNDERSASSSPEGPELADFGVQAFESKGKTKVDAMTETLKQVAPPNASVGVQAFESKVKPRYVDQATEMEMEEPVPEE